MNVELFRSLFQMKVCKNKFSRRLIGTNNLTWGNIPKMKIVSIKDSFESFQIVTTELFYVI